VSITGGLLRKLGMNMYPPPSVTVPVPVGVIRGARVAVCCSTASATGNAGQKTTQAHRLLALLSGSRALLEAETKVVAGNYF